MADEAGERERSDGSGITGLDRSDGARGAASGDFGRIVRGDAMGVVAAGTADEVQRCVAEARASGVPLTIRSGGLSQSGQSVPSGGVTLDVSGLRGPIEVDAKRARVCVPAGTPWRDVVAATLDAGLLPRVVPLNLDLAVAGTLSAGGVGSTSHRFGLAAAHVEEVEVVTGTAARLRASPSADADLFDGVLGGVGRVGVLTEVVLGLRPAGRQVRTVYLLYDDVQAWLVDQQRTARAALVDHMEGSCQAAVQGLVRTPAGRRPFPLWFFGLQLTIEFDGMPPTVEQVIDGLSPYRVLRDEVDETAGFLARYDPRFAMMRATGAWDQTHPWFEVFLPYAAAANVLPRVLEELSLALGDGHRLFVLPRRAPAGVALPDAEELAVFAVLPTGVPQVLLHEATASLDRAWRLLREVGARRYVSGHIANADDAYWRAHFGEGFEAWVGRKARWDPDHVFSSSLFPRGS